MNSLDHNGTTALVQGLSDLRAVSITEALAASLAPGVRREQNASISGSAADLVEALTVAAEKDGSASFAGAECGNVARALLAAYVADPTFQEVTARVISETADDLLLTKPIIAIGVAATLMIIAATVEFRIDIGGFHLEKHTASPELVQRVTDIFLPFKPKN